MHSGCSLVRASWRLSGRVASAGMDGTQDVNPASTSVISVPPSALQKSGISTTWSEMLFQDE